MFKPWADEQKVVVFQVGREEYAVEIGAVREVVPWTQPTPVPDSPPLVEGVVNLRGEIIPVIDLGRLFNTIRIHEGSESRIMVMEVEGQQAGFVVDAVSEVYTAGMSALVPPSPVLRSARLDPAREIVLGILKLGENRLVVLVDPQRVLASTDLDDIPVTSVS